MGPWNFKGCLVLFQRWDPDTVFDELEFKIADFWLQAHNLPLNKMTYDNAKKIRSFIGTFIQSDVHSS